MTLKKVLLFALLANLFCVFPVGHAALPLGLFEPILAINAFDSRADFDTPFMWICSFSLLLLGQILSGIAVFRIQEAKGTISGLVGLTSLVLAVCSIYLTLPEKAPILTAITSIPFIIFTLKFFGKVLHML